MFKILRLLHKIHILKDIKEIKEIKFLFNLINNNSSKTIQAMIYSFNLKIQMMYPYFLI